MSEKLKGEIEGPMILLKDLNIYTFWGVSWAKASIRIYYLYFAM